MSSTMVTRNKGTTTDGILGAAFARVAEELASVFFSGTERVEHAFLWHPVREEIRYWRRDVDAGCTFCSPTRRRWKEPHTPTRHGGYVSR